MLTLPPAASKPRGVSQQKQKGSNAQRDQYNNDDQEDLIEQLNRKLSNVTLNPPTTIPDEMNMADISTMLPTFAQPLYNLLASGVYEQQLLAMVRIRKYLSLQDVLPRIDNVLALDCINFFITFLNMSDCTIWNIEVKIVRDIRRNISGDGPPYRDLILQSGALDVILQLIEMCEDPTVAKDQKYMILRIAVWCVSNLCRGSGRCAPEWLQVTPAFPMLRKLMYIDDTEILADTCWAMCRILNGTHKMNLDTVVIDRELCVRFVALLSEPHPTIQVPSLRSLINIASGPEHHTQLLIDAMAIPVLGSHEMLSHHNSTIRRDALLGISNVTAGTADQVREVTVQDSGSVMRRVLDILRRGDVGGEELNDDTAENHEEGGDWRVLREAAWVISNATSVLDLEITGHLVYRLDLLPSIAQLIDPRRNRKASYVLPAIGLQNPPLLTKLLDIIFNVLRCNEHHPKEQFMKIWVNDCEGGSILLELLKLSSQSSSETHLRHLDNIKLTPRPLQHLRFTQHDNGIKATSQLTAPLGVNVKKRVETILENFFEFGPENEGFGPFFGERQQGSRPGNHSAQEGYASDDQEDDHDDDLEDEEHEIKNAYYSARGGSGKDHTDFDIDDMEERVSKMNLA
ncbi:Importin alpha subunit (Karyopherin alpha subunit) (Serine-rich RNA polymerase I suppressor protein) [Mortierella claussenii]|nr:Importin alpha subunit (Karyopherin alpha subunit) (Serine-rich RNA polymerase I suppressor protein) [Mortierella claussenii]